MSKNGQFHDSNSMRAGFVARLCRNWIAVHRPDVYAALRKLAAAKYPLKTKRRVDAAEYLALVTKVK
jgi:hypothetical protein